MIKEFSGVVRHYHDPKRQAGMDMGNLPEQRPYSYSGLVKSSHDLDGDVKQEIADFFNTISDGEKIKITVECLGKAGTAKGFVWSYTKPHTYERITEQEYAELIEEFKDGKK